MRWRNYERETRGHSCGSGAENQSGGLVKYLCRNILRIALYALLPALLIAQSGWGPDQRLVFMQGGGWYPRAACCGDTIHLVWYQRYSTTIPHEEVFYKRSTDAGETWEADVLLSEEDAIASTFPIVACVNLKVYIFWLEHNYGTLLKKSTDGGTTWSSTDSTLQGAGYHDIFILNDTIFLAGGRDPGDIIFRKSTDGGNTWLPLQIIGYGCYERQAVSAPFVGFVYQVSPFQEIMFKRSTDNGGTWSDSMIISHYDSVGGQSAVIAADSCINFHASWYDYKYSPYPWTGDIFYRASRDSGNTWEPIDSLTVQHRAVASDILAEGSNLHLVWEDDRHDFGNNFEIYYRMSTDLGQTWGNEARLTDALYHSMCPSLICDGGYLHLFWRDCRDSLNNGIGFIYYKRKDLSQGINETTQLEQSMRSWFEVYPTLFTENITIRQSAKSKEHRGKEYPMDYDPMPYALRIEIYDISGKEVIGETKREMEMGRIGDVVHVDTKDLPCGVYFVEVQAGDIREVHKVVKIE